MTMVVVVVVMVMVLYQQPDSEIATLWCCKNVLFSFCSWFGDSF